MTPKPTADRSALQGFAVALAVLFAAVAVASADDRAASTRSNSGSSSSSSSSSASSSSGSSSSSSAVSRSSGGSSVSSSSVSRTTARGREGAARTRTRHDGRGRHGRGGVRIGHGSSFFWHPYWGYWGWGHAWGPGYGYYPPVNYSTTRGYRMGALDLRVDPKRTEVYVDGQYVGLAKQYDGFPSHLWLESGVYEIAFYKEGFATQTRTVKILTDLVLELDIRMLEGRAERPEMDYGGSEYGGSEMDRDDGPEELGARYERRGGPGGHQARVHFRVEPGSALIYLDGNVLGTADELSGLHAGLLLSAGSHRIEVVQRGFDSAEYDLVVEPGEELDLVVDLEPST